MKLLVIVAQDADAPRLRDALIKNGIPVTKLSSTGGFLRKGSTTFISGVEDSQVEFVEQLVDLNSQKRTVVQPGPADVPLRSTPDAVPDQKARKVDVGGATVFVLNVQEFVKL